MDSAINPADLYDLTVSANESSDPGSASSWWDAAPYTQF